MIWVAETTLMLMAAVPPTITVASEAKFEPAIVMMVPPDTPPEVGVTRSMNGLST